MDPWIVKENKDGTVTISKPVYDALKNAANELKYLYSKLAEMADFICDIKARKYIDNDWSPLPDEANRWIPISEKLPKEAEYVAIVVMSDDSYGGGTDISYTVDLGAYCTGDGDIECDGGFFFTCHDINEGQPCKVVAWMPLPEYEDKNEEERFKAGLTRTGTNGANIRVGFAEAVLKIIEECEEW